MQTLSLFLLCILCVTFQAYSFDLDSFQSIIDEVNSRQTTWKAEDSLPPYVKPSSFKKLLGIKKSKEKLPFLSKSTLRNGEIPREFDSRKQWPRCGTIGHIQDQGNCASGWALAAAGVFSDRLCIAKNGTFRAQLSSEQLVACCDGFGTGCEGGDPQDAWEYFYSIGIVTGGDYMSGKGCQPYEIEPCDHTGKTGNLTDCTKLPKRKTPRCIRRCTNRNYERKFSKDLHKSVSGFIMGYDVAEIQKEILTRGPVEAVMYVFADFPTYKTGIYKYTAGEYMGEQAVRLIGWGSEADTDYWLAANSWNTDWGEGGFFRIKRGVNECGIESYIIAGIPQV